MRRNRLFWIVLFSAILLLALAACGTSEEVSDTEGENEAASDTEENSADETAADTEENSTDENAAGTEDNSADKPAADTEEGSEDEGSDTVEGSSDEVSAAADEDSTESSGGGEVLNPNIAEESQGDVEVVFTNEDPQYVHDMDGFKVFVDRYQIVKVTDMSTDFAIPFDDQTDGYVVTAEVTLDNTTDQAMYYNNVHRIQLSNEFDYIPSGITFVRDGKPQSEIETEISKFAAGEKVSGLISFTLTNEQFETLKSVKPKYVIEGGAADNDQFTDSIKGNGTFDFIYSTEQGEQVAGKAHFYPDRLTTDNWADKEMLFEETDINEAQLLGDVHVTLEGVQYTEIIPTDGNEEIFRNFGDNGIVALTVKLHLQNESDEAISIWNIGSKILIDEDRSTVLSAGSAEPSHPKQIEAGEQGEKYHVYLFRKDEFELYEKFELEFGPFTGEDGQRLFKDSTVTFTLPR